MDANEPPRPKGTQGQPPDKQEVAKAMNLAFYQFKLIYLAARDVLPPSTYELSHFDVISHQLLDTATEELRKKFTEAPYSTALAISWAPREFLYRAWRTGRRSRSMKRRDQNSEYNDSISSSSSVYPNSSTGYPGAPSGYSNPAPGYPATASGYPPQSTGYTSHNQPSGRHTATTASSRQGGSKDNWLSVVLR